MTNRNTNDEYDYSRYVTDNLDAKNLVDSVLEKEIGGGVLDSLLIKPSITMNESTFKKYIVTYYRNPTEQNRIAILEFLKSPKVEIKVYDDRNSKLLFVMPPLFSDLIVKSKASEHTQCSTIERIAAEAKIIRERSGYYGDVVFGKMIAERDIIRTDEDETNKVIKDILKRYGVDLDAKAQDTIEPSKEEVTENAQPSNNSEGYIDEW